jgi:hypothetical protein
VRLSDADNPGTSTFASQAGSQSTTSRARSLFAQLGGLGDASPKIAFFLNYLFELVLLSLCNVAARLALWFLTWFHTALPLPDPPPADLTSYLQLSPSRALVTAIDSVTILSAAVISFFRICRFTALLVKDFRGKPDAPQ